MEFDSELSLLSPKFTQDYPPATYPELMHKHGRPYTCLLIDFHDDYFICVPFRSSIGHKNAFMFTGTARSKKTKSGLDYSKIAIISTEPHLYIHGNFHENINTLPCLIFTILWKFKSLHCRRLLNFSHHLTSASLLQSDFRPDHKSGLLSVPNCVS